ncbi:MAG: hypothetical protein BWX96_00638 [Bacteroidetes bacterium ADurb.Bin145]|jgi:hypothetical protein|nr:MAG: hypothetical protein BWX96_00638 [Bacteroidetes bacterium ADurb.Bin145]
MQKDTNKNYPASFDDLIRELESGDYKHLQIFLFREKPNLGFVEDERYLVVNSNGFGLYKLHDLDYKDGKIQLEFIDPETNKLATVTLDIHDTQPDLFIVNWKDVLDLAKDYQPDTDNELLELDREQEME